jgi:hypothetical protein
VWKLKKWFYHKLIGATWALVPLNKCCNCLHCKKFFNGSVLFPCVNDWLNLLCPCQGAHLILYPYSYSYSLSYMYSYACVMAQVLVLIHTRVYVLLWVHIYTYSYASTYVHVYKDSTVHMYLYMSMFTHVSRTYTSTRILANVQVHTNILWNYFHN